MIEVIIKQLIPFGWNERQFSEIEFFDLAKVSGVCVWVEKIGVPGRYFYYRERPVIGIHSELEGYTKLWVQFHELAHHWKHVPTRKPTYCEFAYTLENKEELEADAIALPMVIPLPWLKEPGLFDLWEQGYPASLLERRKLIWERFKF